MDTIEDYSVGDPEQLSPSSGVTDTVTRNGLTFDRVVQISINLDDSRKVDVEVTGVVAAAGGHAELSTSIALRGMR